MDIFGRKRIAKLERELDAIRQDRDQYMYSARSLERTLQEVTELKRSAPEDCVPGEWCKACEFSKTLHYRDYVHNWSEYINVCSKGKSCPNFIQKKENE